jgi:hypothetical protein
MAAMDMADLAATEVTDSVTEDTVEVMAIVAAA